MCLSRRAQADGKAVQPLISGGRAAGTRARIAHGWAQASLAGSEHGGMLVVVGNKRRVVAQKYLHEIMRAYVRSFPLM